MRTGTRMLIATSPKNRPREASGWSATKRAITPAAVSTAAAIPMSTGMMSSHCVRASSARNPAQRSGPATSRLIADSMCEAESMSWS